MAEYTINNRAVITERRAAGGWIAYLKDKRSVYQYGETEVEALTSLRLIIGAAERMARDEVTA